MTEETFSLSRTAVEQAKTLYELTGDIKDINTLLIPRSAIEQAASGVFADAGVVPAFGSM